VSTAVECFAALHYSPFVLGPLFEVFYEREIVQPRNVLLAYLVLPLTLYPPSRDFLKNAKSNSSLRTLCGNPERLYGLANRVEEFRSLTHKSLQVCCDSGGITIDLDVSVKYVRRTLDPLPSPTDSLRAAEKLGGVFGHLDIPAIYRFLGIKRL
jgi:Family of unknown function (DUF6521)